MDFDRIFIEWGYIKIAINSINEASEAGRDHVNPPKGGILIGNVYPIIPYNYTILH